MTTLALETLRADPATEVIVLVSKPPAPELLPRLDEAIRAAGKPVVVCCLGIGPRPGAPGQWVATLEDAARAAVATARGTRVDTVHVRRRSGASVRRWTA